MKRKLFNPSVGSPERLGVEFLETTSLYKDYLAFKEEVLRHKWLESEKMGYDIGMDQALIDWVFRHKAAWQRGRKHISDQTAPTSVAIDHIA
jgi:hypothetical protein